MIKILLQIKDKKLEFLIKRKLNSNQKNLLNTNVINENELVFSDDYIKSNIKLVHNFIKELVSDYEINTLIIKESFIAPLILHICSNIPSIKNLYLLEETLLNYDTCNYIIKSNNIKTVYLYNIPTYLLELLDSKNIKVNSRNEILFTSSFTEQNNLNTFSSLYYKTTIYLTFPFNKEDEEDFLSFIKINKYLKKIYINKISKKDIEFILENLYKYKLKNIKILIKENIQDYELIEYLKKINKRNSKINNIKFKIDYSKDYLENNLVNQIQLNTIKICVYMTLFIISSVVVFVFYSNYRSMQKVDDIKEDISGIIAEYKDKEDNKLENNNDNDNDNNENIVEEKKIINFEVASLRELNEDTVGWLKVNNTNVDYPVVQAEDNDYYLNKNFKKNKDSSGWIFMDYRADAKNLSQNTIIFGHNMYYSGVMFGTLYKAKHSSWYKNKENQIISFDTLYDKMKWQIFSIYVIPVTNDYLVADFSTKEKYQDFLDLITKRSLYDFNIPVSQEDKILTLSTCSDNGQKRLVIHAVLLDK